MYIMYIKIALTWMDSTLLTQNQRTVQGEPRLLSIEACLGVHVCLYVFTCMYVWMYACMEVDGGVNKNV